MTGQDIQDLFYILIREKSTNTSISTTNFAKLMTLAYSQVVADIIPETILSRQSVAVTSTRLVTRTSATSLEVTSNAGISAGTDICIYSGNRYDFCRVATKNINGTTITLDSPGLVYSSHPTGSSGAIVVPVSFIITATRNNLCVNWRVNSTTENSITNMEPVLDSDIYKFGTKYDSKGVPSKFSMVLPTEMKIYPVPDKDGYLEIVYLNKVVYTLTTSDTPVMLDADAHMCIVYWLLAHNALRERDFKAYQDYYNTYIGSVIRAKMELQNKRAANQPMTFKRGNI